MDLLFPHHESEIAQSVAANNKMPVRCWMHNNMVTINGQKMGKSLGNAVSLEDFFTGSHPLLEQAYTPQTIRFFMLQAHYRGTLDFSNEALQASEKGLKKLLTALGTLQKIQASDTSTISADKLKGSCYEAMNDDFNSPVLIGHLFDGVRMINSIQDGKDKINKENLEILRTLFQDFVVEILGLKPEETAGNDQALSDDLMSLVISIRNDARVNKDYATSDKIRDALAKLSIQLKDSKDGTSWEEG